MSLKKISKTEAIDLVDEGAEVYILQRITDKTTLAELRHALAFAVVTRDEEDIREKMQQTEEQIEEDRKPFPELQKMADDISERLERLGKAMSGEEPEGVAEQTEAPANKSRKPKSIVDHDKIVELYQSGWTTKAIAKVVEASDQTVRNHLKAAGIPLRVKI